MLIYLRKITCYTLHAHLQVLFPRPRFKNYYEISFFNLDEFGNYYYDPDPFFEGMDVFLSALYKKKFCYIDGILYYVNYDYNEFGDITKVIMKVL